MIHTTWPQDNFPFSADKTPLIIETNGKIIPQWQIDKYGLCDTLPKSPVTVNTPQEQIQLIPMGAARLRKSAFIVVD